MINAPKPNNEVLVANRPHSVTTAIGSCQAKHGMRTCTMSTQTFVGNHFAAQYTANSLRLRQDRRSRGGKCKQKMRQLLGERIAKVDPLIQTFTRRRQIVQFSRGCTKVFKVMSEMHSPYSFFSA